MPSVCGMPMTSPQPCWKTSVSTPKAAATDSRLSTIALIGITIDRNVTSSSRNAIVEHEAEHERRVRRQVVVAVHGLGGVAADVDRRCRGREPNGRRDELLAQRGERGLRLGVGAVAGQRQADDARPCRRG